MYFPFPENVHQHVFLFLEYVRQTKFLSLWKILSESESYRMIKRN